MRVLLIALLAAISYAQTACELGDKVFARDVIGNVFLGDLTSIEPATGATVSWDFPEIGSETGLTTSDVFSTTDDSTCGGNWRTNVCGVGDPVWAKGDAFITDKLWFKAEVEAVTTSTITVKWKDTGLTSTVSINDAEKCDCDDGKCIPCQNHCPCANDPITRCEPLGALCQNEDDNICNTGDSTANAGYGCESSMCTGGFCLGSEALNNAPMCGTLGEYGHGCTTNDDCGIYWGGQTPTVCDAGTGTCKIVNGGRCDMNVMASLVQQTQWGGANSMCQSGFCLNSDMVWGPSLCGTIGEHGSGCDSTNDDVNGMNPACLDGAYAACPGGQCFQPSLLYATAYGGANFKCVNSKCVVDYGNGPAGKIYCDDLTTVDDYGGTNGVGCASSLCAGGYLFLNLPAYDQCGTLGSYGDGCSSDAQCLESGTQVRGTGSKAPTICVDSKCVIVNGGICSFNEAYKDSAIGGALDLCLSGWCLSDLVLAGEPVCGTIADKGSGCVSASNNVDGTNAACLDKAKEACETATTVGCAVNNALETYSCDNDQCLVDDGGKCFAETANWAGCTGGACVQLDSGWQCATAASNSNSATSHGDPIIWTFHGECYDLHKDGLYEAAAHPDFNHKVMIGVYNDFMREIQIVDDNGNLLLIYTVNDDLYHDEDSWPHKVETEEFSCADMKETECTDRYKQLHFYALEFQFDVHLLLHDYKDPALKEGELGVHLDVYPIPFRGFYKKDHIDRYTGLYFENPLPEQLDYCVGDTKRRSS
jgi:hypothetical protein